MLRIPVLEPALEPARELDAPDTDLDRLGCGSMLVLREDASELAGRDGRASSDVFDDRCGCSDARRDSMDDEAPCRRIFASDCCE